MPSASIVSNQMSSLLSSEGALTTLHERSDARSYSRELLLRVPPLRQRGCLTTLHERSDARSYCFWLLSARAWACSKACCGACSSDPESASDRVPSPDSAVVLLVYLGIMRQRKTASCVGEKLKVLNLCFCFVFLYALDLSLGVIDYCAILSDG
jgi:hypothetical protein